MNDTLEKRVTDVENLVWEIPNLLNTRFTRFEAALADNTARLTSLERTITSVLTDVRDLRGGVTRQLVEQDKRLAAMEGRLAGIEGQLAEILKRLPT